MKIILVDYNQLKFYMKQISKIKELSKILKTQNH